MRERAQIPVLAYTYKDLQQGFVVLAGLDYKHTIHI